MKQLFKSSNLFPIITAFLLPTLILSTVLAIKGIWWGSDTTILASDAFHQYVIFHQALRNILHGDGSLFYTFTSGLGLNFYALSSYYLGSFLAPFSYFFQLDTMPDALYLFTIFKFGLTGLSTYISLSAIYKKLHPLLAILLSSSFALMSFSTSQLEITTWLDVFILVPLILLGLQRLIEGKGRILYFISLTCLFIQNYYFGYMTALFLIFWFPVQLSWDFKKRISSIIDFIVVSFLSGITSMIMLLPTYLDLKTHGETFTAITNLKTEASWYLDVFAKNIVGSYDTTKFGAIPMIYVGIFPLLLALTFFFLPSIKWQIKLSYTLLLTVVITSFYLQPLDLLWQGMHAPNMFLHRYAWILSLVIIYMAAETLTRITELKINYFLPPILFLSFGYLLTFFFINHYEFLESLHFLLTFEFLIAYFILLWIMSKKNISIPLFATFSLLFVLIEAGLNTHYQVEGLSSEWHFPSRSNYAEHLTEIDTLVKYSQSINDEFYRTERLFPQTGNDSMKYQYNGISQFSSIRNRSSSSTLDKLGFRSDGTNLNLRYQNNTLIADSLFAIKYNLVAGELSKFGFTNRQSSGTVNLYENSYALPLAILTETTYEDVEFTNLTLDNQTHFLNQLAGLKETYYYSINPIEGHNGTELNGRVTITSDDSNAGPSIQYSLLVPAHTQLYVTIPSLHFSNDANKQVQILVNNVSKNFTLDNTFSFFDVGYMETEQVVSLTIHFPQNTQVSFDTPQFYRLDTVAYQKAIEKIKEKKVTVYEAGNQVSVNYTAESDGSLILTIPYDKGWSAQQNGQPLTIAKAQEGLMKINVSQGTGTIILTFIPHGLIIGCYCFISGILLFVCYHYTRSKRKR